MYTIRHLSLIKVECLGESRETYLQVLRLLLDWQREDSPVDTFVLVNKLAVLFQNSKNMFLKNLLFFSGLLECTNGYRIQCSPDMNSVRHYTLVAPAFPPLSAESSRLVMKTWLETEYRKTYPSVTLDSTQAQASSSQVNPVNISISTVDADFRDRVDLLNVPPELKTGGADWFAIFNPKLERILDVHSVHTLLHESVVCCVRFSSNGRYLATGCNKSAQIYDAMTGSKIRVFAHNRDPLIIDMHIRTVCFSPDGRHLATGAEDDKIRIWDVATGSILRTFGGHRDLISSLEFSPDGRLIVSCSGDYTVRIWDLMDASSRVLTLKDSDPDPYSGFTSVVISPNGRLLAVGNLDKLVYIWDMNTARLVEILKGHSHSVYDVKFTPDGKGLLSGSLDNTMKYWNVSGLMNLSRVELEARAETLANTGPEEIQNQRDHLSRCILTFTGHRDYVLSVSISPNCQWVVSGSKDMGIQFWDPMTGISHCMLNGHTNSVISVDFSPAGAMLASGSGDMQARIWCCTSI